MIVEKEQNDSKRVLVSIIVTAAKQSALQIGVVLRDSIVTIQDRDPQMGIRKYVGTGLNNSIFLLLGAHLWVVQHLGLRISVSYQASVSQSLLQHQ